MSEHNRVVFSDAHKPVATVTILGDPLLEEFFAQVEHDCTGVGGVRWDDPGRLAAQFVVFHADKNRQAFIRRDAAKLAGKGPTEFLSVYVGAMGWDVGHFVKCSSSRKRPTVKTQKNHKALA